LFWRAVSEPPGPAQNLKNNPMQAGMRMRSVADRRDQEIRKTTLVPGSGFASPVGVRKIRKTTPGGFRAPSNDNERSNAWVA
jgi:hypothetical protein